MSDRLAREWMFWKDEFVEKNAPKSRYEASLKPLGKCGTVHGFWESWSAVPSVEVLQDKKVTIHFMQSGVKPMWEDRANVRGGTVTIRCDKDVTAVVWRGLVIDLISGAQDRDLGDGTVLGVSVSMKRRNNLLIVWLNTTGTAFHEAVTARILALFPQLKESDVNWRGLCRVTDAQKTKHTLQSVINGVHVFPKKFWVQSGQSSRAVDRNQLKMHCLWNFLWHILHWTFGMVVVLR